MQDNTVARAVVEAVARDKNVDPMDLPPLHDAMDPDAMADVVTTGRANSSVFYLEFEYADRLVTIDGDDVSIRSTQA